MKPTLPVELLREIVRLVFSDAPSAKRVVDSPGICSKPSWKVVDPLSLASRTLRSLALEMWFQVFFVDKPEQMRTGLSFFPQLGSRWVRHLHCVQPADALSVLEWDLSGYLVITSIRYDWLSGFDQDFWDVFPFLNAPSMMQELDIRGFQWPAPHAYAHIETSFPNLKVLKLRQSLIWCSLCNTCVTPRFKNPGPEKIIYEGGPGLPRHYARVLAPLTQLHTVCIEIPDFGSGIIAVGDKEGQNPYLWTGECERCIEVLYPDQDFLEKWVSQKKSPARGLPKEQNGHMEGDLKYLIPPSLHRVEWTFRPPLLEDYMVEADDILADHWAEE
ncbi:hypothetical protein AX16_002459 [Volvariella volvacea WC 439]|nr:hypothetical protein AX16_002459 [Volvariella volvacea WC 439]